MTNALIALIGILALLDIITTRKALKRPRTREANPIIRAMMRHGNLWIIIKLAVTAGAVYALRDAPILIAAISAVYAIVIWNNYKAGRGK